MTDESGQPPDSLLPYEDWAETAQRQVMVQALSYVAEHGLPGGHHFYITFRTDHPNTVIPARLRAQYPQEMTIVLQHQFGRLTVDAAAGEFSVGLSFGGVPSTLHVALGAVTAFVDPYVQFGLRFRPALPPEQPAPAAPPPPAPAADGDTPQVVSLDAFRRRPTPRD